MTIRSLAPGASYTPDTVSLVGTANIFAGGVTLSTGAINSVGLFWYQLPQSVGNGFTASFAVNSTTVALNYGFAFVLQPSSLSSLGFGDVGLGYRGLPSYLAVRLERVNSASYVANSATTLFNVTVEATSGNVLASATVWGRM